MLKVLMEKADNMQEHRYNAHREKQGIIRRISKYHNRNRINLMRS